MALQIGDTAPDFTLPATKCGEVSLQALRGRPVILYFYPKDDTPGCTQEACDFRDNIKALEKLDAMVIGLSKDSMKKHEKFSGKFDLNFPLASDENGDVVKAYDAWVEKSMYGKKYMGIERCTFLIDTQGKIAQMWRNVKVTDHVKDVQKAITALSQDKAA